ncbi:MAG: hypothetical protein KDE54_18735, partial [Caldilineaceae bacterium]|nr:hypothetical protein [Caldilineaceae bacterium]
WEWVGLGCSLSRHPGCSYWQHFAGVLHLLSRSFDFNRVKNPFWYFMVVLFNPVVAVFAYGFMHATDNSIPKHLDLSVSVLPMFILFLIAALGEEIGWSGYAKNNYGLDFRSCWQERFCPCCISCYDKFELATFPNTWFFLRS